jgi:hypothetical protein
VQRDLEDQIREEYETLGLTYNTNQKAMEPITTSGILKDLKSGYTRFKKDDKGYGSIEEKYGLTVDEVKELFKLDSLKARKTAEPKRKLEIIDDLAQPTNITVPRAEVVAITPGSIGTFELPSISDALASLANSISPEPMKDSPAVVAEAEALHKAATDDKTSIFA